MTVIKVADDKQPHIDALTALLERPDLDQRTRKKIEIEVWAMRAGIRGEREAAYEIDFHYAKREGYVVIHDLRLEFAGRVAQIDHLLINRALDVWVCETKAFSEGVKIDDYGEWYRYGGKHANGMASPVEQNRRHVAVLTGMFDQGAVRLPRRLVTIKPTIFPVVLISNEARIDRPRTKKAAVAVPGLDTVIKVEQLVRKIEQTFHDRNPLGILAKVVGPSTILDLGRQLVALHKPGTFDYQSKFGIPATSPADGVAAVVAPLKVASPPRSGGAVCAECGKTVSPKVEAFSLEHGDRFGGRVLCFDCQQSVPRPTSRQAP